MTQPIVIDPSRAQAETVIRWLRDEHLTLLGGSTGFYCNRSIIRRAARDGEMKCLVIGRTVIGFAVFGSVTIDIFEIRPGYRGQGLGQSFARQLIATLFSRGASAIYVECSPAESESFWRELGFVPQDEKYQSLGGNLKLILPRAADERTTTRT